MLVRLELVEQRGRDCPRVTRTLPPARPNPRALMRRPSMVRASRPSSRSPDNPSSYRTRALQVLRSQHIGAFVCPVA